MANVTAGQLINERADKEVRDLFVSHHADSSRTESMAESLEHDSTYSLAGSESAMMPQPAKRAACP
jgi:hypothetical protein